MPRPDATDGQSPGQQAVEGGKAPPTRRDIEIELFRRFQQGDVYLPGNRFPSVKALSNELGSTNGTTERAIKKFKDAGLVIVGQRTSDGMTVSDSVEDSVVLDRLEHTIFSTPIRRGGRKRRTVVDVPSTETEQALPTQDVHTGSNDEKIPPVETSKARVDEKGRQSDISVAPNTETPVELVRVRRHQPSQLREEKPVVLFGGHAEDLERELPPLTLNTMAVLSASVGNSEAKAVLFVKIQPGVENTESALYHMIRDDQVGEAWTDIRPSTPVGWCEESFQPAGLVTITGPRRGRSFTRTVDEIGYLAEAWAGQSLAFSERHPKLALSQLQAFRLLDPETTDTALSGTLLRIRLLQELAGVSDFISERHLAEALFGESYVNINLRKTLAGHLNSLSNTGLITIEKAEKGKSYATFAVKEDRPSEDPPKIPHRATLMQQIYSVITPQAESKYVACPSPFTYDLLYKILCVKYPELRGFQDTTGINSRISTVLNHLVREGYIDSTGLTKDERKRIHVPETSQEIFSEYNDLIDAFRNGNSDYLAKSRKLARSIVIVPERFSGLLEKAKVASTRRMKRATVNETPANAAQEDAEIIASAEAPKVNNRRWIIDYITDDLRARILNGESIDTDEDNTTALVREYEISATAIREIFQTLRREEVSDSIPVRQVKKDITPDAQSEEPKMAAANANTQNRQTTHDKGSATPSAPKDQSRKTIEEQYHEWEQEIRARGDIPGHIVKAEVIQPPEFVATYLRMSPTGQVNRIAHTRLITTTTALGSKVRYVHDVTNIFISPQWRKQLPTDLPDDREINVADFATRTAERTQTRAPKETALKQFRITEDVPLITTITVYYDEHKKPYAVKTHTIPETPPIII